MVIDRDMDIPYIKHTELRIDSEFYFTKQDIWVSRCDVCINGSHFIDRDNNDIHYYLPMIKKK